MLRAALALDRATDAVTLFEGLAVALPADAPLEAVAREDGASAGAWRRSRRPGFVAPLAALDEIETGWMVDLMPSARLAEGYLARRIVGQADPAVRFAAIEAMGPARLAAALDARPERTDAAGALFAFGPADRPTVYVRVQDATPRPDGTRAEHWLAAPPHVATPREAVAWTFGLPEGRYRPNAES